MMHVIAHLSDFHVDDGEHSRSRAARTMSFVHGLPGPLTAVVVSGDLADHGMPSEYAFVRDLLAGDVPVVTCPGNHDVRGPYREVLLGEPPAGDPVNRAHRVGGVTFAMCDSSIPEQNDGYLADETLHWLDDVLATASDVPAFVCFHHPPVPLASPFLDRIRQFGADRLAEVLARHEQVVALLCGHAHTPAATTFAGRPVLVAPGVVSTLRFPWEGDDSFDLGLPPAIAFHVLEDGHLVTHYRVVPEA
jgi:3',5'-cyclic-AMP phosphodiesterase